MGGYSYIWLACHCGHEVTGAVALMPELLDPNGQAHLETLERLRCTACGHVGRPKFVRFGWTTSGDPSRLL